MKGRGRRRPEEGKAKQVMRCMGSRYRDGSEAIGRMKPGQSGGVIVETIRNNLLRGLS